MDAETRRAETKLDRELAFSIQPHADYSCGDLHPSLRECRRFKGHEGQHAAGYGTGRLRWGSATAVAVDQDGTVLTVVQHQGDRP